MDTTSLKESTRFDPNNVIQTGLESIVSGLGFDVVNDSNPNKFTDVEFTFSTKTDRWTAYSVQHDGLYLCAVIKKRFEV